MSMFRQIFDATFNPILMRDYIRCQTIAPTNIVPPTFPNSHPNPYDILFAFTPGNFAEYQVIFESI
jgi:hypothetical protein